MSIKSDSLTVGDVMLSVKNTPKTSRNSMLKEVFEIMDQHHLGLVCITDVNDTLEGIITDGDIRRTLTQVQKPIAALMSDDVVTHAIQTPLTVSSSTPLSDAITLMGSKKVWDLPVVENDKLLGLLHLHSAIKALMYNLS